MTLFIYRAFYDRDNTVDELFHVLPTPYLGEILFLQKNTDLFCISLYPGDRLFLESNVSGISDKEHGGKPTRSGHARLECGRFALYGCNF